MQVLNSMPDRALTDDEIGRLKQTRVSDDEDDQQVEKPTEHKKQGRQSDEALDARNIAFSESNPSDPHCEGESSGFSDQKDGDPADEKFTGDFGDSKDGDTGGSNADICKVKPDDAQCTGGGSGSDDGSKSESTPPPAAPPIDPKTKSPGK